MKKLLVFFLCLSILFSCEGQDIIVKTSTTSFNKLNEEDLIKQFNSDLIRLNEASNNKDWDSVFDLTYYKLFEMASKEQMVETMESVFKMFKDFQIRLTKITDIYPIVNYEGDQFTRFFYDNELIITFHNTDDLDNYLPGFTEGYGDNVKVFRNTNSIRIQMESSQFAVLQENSSDWKYLEFKQGQEEMLIQYDIIPVTVIEKLTE